MKENEIRLANCGRVFVKLSHLYLYRSYGDPMILIRVFKVCREWLVSIGYCAFYIIRPSTT
jgi:hypothetical protein